MKKVVDKLLHHHHHTNESDSPIRETHHSTKETHTTHAYPVRVKEGHTTHIVKKNLVTDSSGMVVHKEVITPIEETVVRPAVVEEIIREDVVVEVQPVIHRLIEIPEVHHIEKHVYEKVLPSGPNVITKQPIVEVTVQPRIIEDVTTIVHREVPETVVVHEEQHTNEVLVRPTVHTKEVIEGEHTTVTASSVAQFPVATTITNATTAASPMAFNANTYSTTSTTTHIHNDSDSHLWQIAEPHEKVAVRTSHVSNSTSSVLPTQKWVVAFPHAMKMSRQKKSDKSKDSHEEKDEKEKKGKVKEKVKEKGEEKEKSKGKEKNKEKKAEESDDEIKDKEKGLMKESDDVILTGANDPRAAHAASGLSLDHPVFVERVYEPTSLDLRAQLSLERRADLLAGGSDLPGFSARPHMLSTDRGLDDLERGSQIGLESFPSDRENSHKKDKDSDDSSDDDKDSKKDKHKDKEDRKGSSSPSHKNKLEQELRKKNANQASSRFVMSSLKADV